MLGANTQTLETTNSGTCIDMILYLSTCVCFNTLLSCARHDAQRFCLLFKCSTHFLCHTNVCSLTHSHLSFVQRQSVLNCSLKINHSKLLLRPPGLARLNNSWAVELCILHACKLLITLLHCFPRTPLQQNTSISKCMIHSVCNTASTVCCSPSCPEVIHKAYGRTC